MNEEATPTITIAIEIADPVLADRLASLLGGVAGVSLVARGDAADVTLTARQAQPGTETQDAELTPRELDILNGIARQIKWTAGEGAATLAKKRASGRKLR